MNYERLYVLKSVSELGQKYIYIKIGNVERSVEHFLLMCSGCNFYIEQFISDHLMYISKCLIVENLIFIYWWYAWKCMHVNDIF